MRGGDVTIPTGVLTTRLIDFSVDYALNDKWSISAALLLISRKVFGPNRSHDPLRIIPPHTESEFIDDGQFHTYWQDLRLGARYLAITSKGAALSKGPPPPPEVFTTEPWYQHDRMIRHNYISTGMGTTVALGNRNVLGIDWLRMTRAQDVFKLKNALNFSVSRSFGPPAPSKHAGARQLPTTPD